MEEIKQLHQTLELNVERIQQALDDLKKVAINGTLLDTTKTFKIGELSCVIGMNLEDLKLDLDELGRLISKQKAEPIKKDKPVNVSERLAKASADRLTQVAKEEAERRKIINNLWTVENELRSLYDYKPDSTEPKVESTLHIGEDKLKECDYHKVEPVDFKGPRTTGYNEIVDVACHKSASGIDFRIVHKEDNIRKLHIVELYVYLSDFHFKTAEEYVQRVRGIIETTYKWFPSPKSEKVVRIFVDKVSFKVILRELENRHFSNSFISSAPGKDEQLKPCITLNNDLGLIYIEPERS